MAAHKMEVGICNIYIQQGTHIQTIHEKLLQINQTAQYKNGQETWTGNLQYKLSRWPKHMQKKKKKLSWKSDLKKAQSQ